MDGVYLASVNELMRLLNALVHLAIPMLSQIDYFVVIFVYTHYTLHTIRSS